jgi:hypothetical protein
VHQELLAAAPSATAVGDEGRLQRTKLPRLGTDVCRHRDKQAKMAKYEKSFTTALHAQTSYRHGVNC